MTIARGIKTLSFGYFRNFSDVPDTEENLSADVVWESDGENCSILSVSSWPDSVMLDASINPAAVESHAILERAEGQNPPARVSVYDNPKFDTQSHLKNSKMCCSKITVSFENSGKYAFGNNALTFFGKIFDDYALNLSSNSLFEKEFLFCSESISEIANEKGLLQHGDTFVDRKIYPYGGLCEYGMHPKQMESCVFCSMPGKNFVSLFVSPLSAMQNSGIDPTNDLQSESGHRFIGIKNFSISQKTNLYDELKNGFCKIEVINKNTNEKSTYKSNGVFHTSKTNLITINFIKEEQ
ncbi:MAG: hypothetical protein LBJ96_01495 [Holosporaceae bacterium]|jgi:hypothetical protein|nr:hypothetical protein [Holosporaceae bacterium]